MSQGDNNGTVREDPADTEEVPADARLLVELHRTRVYRLKSGKLFLQEIRET